MSILRSEVKVWTVIKKIVIAVLDIKYHVIWVTKYRYNVLRGPIAHRTRELIRQGCEARGITILQGSVGKDHIHLLLSCPPSLAPVKLCSI